MSDLGNTWMRLRASGKAEWRRGMTARWAGACHDSTTLVVGAISPSGAPLGHYGDVPGEAVPDWSDGPTKGALLDQARERWAEHVVLWIEPSFSLDLSTDWEGRWSIGWLGVTEGTSRPPDQDYPSEAAALLAALETAPERT